MLTKGPENNKITFHITTQMRFNVKDIVYLEMALNQVKLPSTGLFTSYDINCSFLVSLISRAELTQNVTYLHITPPGPHFITRH